MATLNFSTELKISGLVELVEDKEHIQDMFNLKIYPKKISLKFPLV